MSIFFEAHAIARIWRTGEQFGSDSSITNQQMNIRHWQLLRTVLKHNVEDDEKFPGLQFVQSFSSFQALRISPGNEGKRFISTWTGLSGLNSHDTDMNIFVFWAIWLWLEVSIGKSWGVFPGRPSMWACPLAELPPLSNNMQDALPWFVWIILKAMEWSQSNLKGEHLSFSESLETLDWITFWNGMKFCNKQNESNW
jgi:hypothetical protein